MADNNRTEQKTSIDTNMVATLTLTTHRAELKEIADNTVFRKDVKSTNGNNSGVFSIDFSAIDHIIQPITNDSVITVNNLIDGDVKYLTITKASGDEIAFDNLTDTGIDEYWNGQTTLLYAIINKNSNEYAVPLTPSIASATETREGYLEVTTNAEIQAGTLDTKIVTPLKLRANSSYTTPTFDPTYTNIDLGYRLNNIGQLEINGKFTFDGVLDSYICTFTIDSSLVSNDIYTHVLAYRLGSTLGYSAMVGINSTTGVVTVVRGTEGSTWSTSYDYSLNIVMALG